MKWALVYLNDSLVYGPFDSEEAALAYAHVLFPDPEEYEHADCNSDFYATPLRTPEG